MVIDILGNFNDPEYIQLDSVSATIDNIKYYKDNHQKEDLQKIIVLKPADPDRAVDFISAAMWEAGGGTLVLDEADAFNEAEAPCFDQLVRYGRNRGVNIVIGCRRPYEISRNITAGMNKLFVFQTIETRDIEYFEKTIMGPRAQQLKNIQQFHGLYLDYDAKTTGLFAIDLNGVVYKLTEETLR